MGPPVRMWWAHFAYTDLEPVFEECLRDLVAILALDHSDQPTA
ncbi:hypothetical protein [Streptosporangium sp. KLBMP 9127]